MVRHSLGMRGEKFTRAGVEPAAAVGRKSSQPAGGRGAKPGPREREGSLQPSRWKGFRKQSGFLGWLPFCHGTRNKGEF